MLLDRLRKPRSIRVEKAITVDRPPENLYRFWRQLERLPEIMDHLKSVTKIDDRKSHWVARGPVGLKVEWFSDLTVDIPNKQLDWRSLEGSDVKNSGSVTIRPLSGGQRSEIKVLLSYDPPAGLLGAAVARLFGRDPGSELEEGLRRFKRIMESDGAPAETHRKAG